MKILHKCNSSITSRASPSTEALSKKGYIKEQFTQNGKFSRGDFSWSLDISGAARQNSEIAFS